MRYLSTRGGMAPATFSEILLGGLAPDGGLAVPEHYPTLAPGELAGWRGLSYPELAFAILSKFADDLPAADLRALIDRTYSADTFRTEAITPVTNLLDNVWLLRLSNGPTLAFKDIAMQLL
ncbi:MAG: threonine synthase, partial [Candidatus Competibacteraceae bacterium]|nr:threonine synthase [Candidatus Competibacteraceae bacterium]